MSERHPPFRGITLILLLAGGLLTGCAQWVPPVPFPFDYPEPKEPVEPAAAIPKVIVQSHGFYLNGEDSVVGRLATVPVREGDTLLDIARHFGLGYQSIVDANPGVDVWIPHEGESVVLPLQLILPEAPRKGVVINLAAMRLFYFTEGKKPALSTWPIGIGREGRSTPMGVMSVARKAKNPTWYVPDSIRRTHAEQGDPLPAVVPPGPDNPLGLYALYLSKPSYLIHGTNKPFSIGLRASNGCIRLYPEDIERAFKEIPTNTPVMVVNQPYLLGWLDGGLYLEAHKPFDELNGPQEKKRLLAELRLMAKKQSLKLDWPKIEETLAQALGIPMPVFEQAESLGERLAAATPLERPARLAGQPGAVEPAANGWLLQTAETDDEYKARRLAAQLNHIGPRIPALAVAKGLRYQVIAGPFAQEKAARKAQLILDVDFATKAELVKPPKI